MLAIASVFSTLAIAHEVIPRQLLYGVDRAKITGIAADHEPFALDQTVRVAIEVEMLPGMHVNANPPTFDWMIPVEVSVKVIHLLTKNRISQRSLKRLREKQTHRRLITQ